MFSARRVSPLPIFPRHSGLEGPPKLSVHAVSRFRDPLLACKHQVLDAHRDPSCSAASSIRSRPFGPPAGRGATREGRSSERPNGWRHDHSSAPFSPSTPSPLARARPRRTLRRPRRHEPPREEVRLGPGSRPGGRHCPLLPSTPNPPGRLRRPHTGGWPPTSRILGRGEPLRARVPGALRRRGAISVAPLD